MKRCSGTSVVKVVWRAERRPSPSTATASTLYFAGQAEPVPVVRRQRQPVRRRSGPAPLGRCRVLDPRHLHPLQPAVGDRHLEPVSGARRSWRRPRGRPGSASPGDRGRAADERRRRRCSPSVRPARSAVLRHVSTAADAAPVLRFATWSHASPNDGPPRGNVSAGRSGGQNRGEDTRWGAAAGTPRTPAARWPLRRAAGGRQVSSAAEQEAVGNRSGPTGHVAVRTTGSSGRTRRARPEGPRRGRPPRRPVWPGAPTPLGARFRVGPGRGGGHQLRPVGRRRRGRRAVPLRRATAPRPGSR